MSEKVLKAAAIGAVATAALVSEADAALGDQVVGNLIAKIKEGDDNTRGEAWQTAWRLGAPAVSPLADLMEDGNFEVARSARRGLWEIVRWAGRPNAPTEGKLVAEHLLGLLKGNRPVAVVREVIWMLSEIAGDEAVAPVAALLANKELREDARMVLQRIPGKKSLGALQSGLKSVPEDFKINVVQSLRTRGVKVSGYPCRKMTPARKTKVTPVQ